MNSTLKSALFVCVMLAVSVPLRSEETPTAQPKDSGALPQAQADIELADNHFRQGKALLDQHQYAEAIDHYQAAFEIDKVHRRGHAAYDLSYIGAAYWSLSRYEEALKYFQEAVVIQREVKDRLGEGTTLNNIGFSYYNLSRYEEALKYFQEALVIRREVKDRLGEGTTLNNIGAAYQSLSRYEEALKYYQEALPIGREVKDRAGEATTLHNIALACDSLSRYEEAMKYFQEALVIRREVKDRLGEGTTLNNIGAAYQSLSRYEEALKYYQEALVIRREVKDRAGEGTTLNNIASAYEHLSRYEEALKYYEQALTIERDVKDRAVEAATLNNIGLVYQRLSRYQEALKYYQEALPIRHDVKDRAGEAVTLNNIGGAYNLLGRYEEALKYYQEALVIRREVKDRSGEATTLVNIGVAYKSLSRSEEALKYYQEALVIKREVKDRAGEASTLNNIGLAYYSLSRYEEGLKYFQEALAIERKVKDRTDEATTLNNIGAAYDSLSRYEEALKYYQSALAIKREIKDRDGEAMTLSNLMFGWRDQGKSHLAIFYGKQAVNAFQEIRSNIRGLNKEIQQSFLKSKENPYRQLANLLIDEGRLPEAQQVLGLLKKEEYFEFVRRDSKAADSLAGRATLTSVEADWEKRYRDIADRVTAIGTDRGALIAKKSRTPEEEQRLAALEKDLEVANQAFQKFLDQLADESAGKQISGDKLKQVKEAQGLMSDLAELGSGAVALYTLVGEEKYRVILVTPDVEKAAEYPIKAADLNRKVLAFREALQNPSRDPLPAAQELYQILVAPIAKDLEAAKAETVMWSLDGTLRYIPTAALHDGEKYLAERYRNVVFTPASNARLKDPVSTSWNALGLGVSKAHGDFRALPGVVKELKAIIRGETGEESEGVLPGSRKLDEEFTADSMLAALHTRYGLVHIASHFQFQPGNETSSYLLLGDGNRLTLDRIKSLPNLFRGVELLTLSACDTATGGAGADGKEVEGFGVLAQRQGAKAVMATLWPVADESTQLLMREFYRLHQEKPGTLKSEALRQAQLELLHGEIKSTQANGSDGARSATLTASREKSFTPDPQAPFAHPYYWAPFILIGNWK